ncbi:MAG: type II toxin-antitoxin system PemK/MazF family toxin [Candidatus Gracilibacteria bacterium]|nr:type II toxin-antitoxin system PemK/MazF family toxin [Candidatus Gracilibacteria bacterium]
MDKDFDKWNNRKKEIELNIENNDITFNNGEIWWSTIGLNLKTEACGKGEEFRRPVLILKRLSSEMFVAIPLTSKRKIGSWFYEYELEGEVNYVMLYQVKMMHSSRLQRKIGKIEHDNFLEIKKRLKLLLNL